MEVSGIAAQQALFRLNLSMAVMKTANEAQQAMVEMVAATVDASRGQNLNISV